jgi:hypothetical protein
VRRIEHHDVLIVADDQTLLSTSKLQPSSWNLSFVTTRVTLSAINALRSSRMRFSQDHHGAQHLTGTHLVERFLDTVETDAFGGEALQRKSALTVQADQRREVTLGQAVAVPRRLQYPPREKKSTSGISAFMSGVGTPDQHYGAG